MCKFNIRREYCKKVHSLLSPKTKKGLKMKCIFTNHFKVLKSKESYMTMKEYILDPILQKFLNLSPPLG